MKRNFATILLAGAAALGLAVPAVAADKLTLGFLTTLSGPGAVVGTPIRDGMNLAVETLGGKVGGLPTTVLIEDDQQKSDVALQIVDKFTKSDHVDAIVGFGFSNLLLAVYHPIIQSETIMIDANPGPSLIAGKDCSKYFFSVSWQGDTWAEAMGGYLQDKGLQNVYVMAPNYAAGKDVVNGFKRYFKGSIAGEVYTPLTQLDFSAELSQLKAANPSAVFAFYPGGVAIQFIKQYTQAGLKEKFPLYTAYAVENNTLPAIGDSAIGLIRTTYWDEESANPVNKQFVSAFTAKYHYRPDEEAVQGYDSIMLLDSAVRGVGGKIEDKEAFLAAIKKADFKSVRGAFAFNNNHFPIQNYYVGHIVKNPDGELHTMIDSIALKDHGDAYAAQCPLQ